MIENFGVVPFLYTVKISVKIPDFFNLFPFILGKQTDLPLPLSCIEL